MDYKKIDFTTILGKTDKNGHWLEIKEKQDNGDTHEQSQPSTMDEDADMYVFEGVDYRGAAQKADIDLFDRLILDDDQGSPTKANSSNQRVSERPQRRQMTEEEKAARAAKARETKARRKQEMVRRERERDFFISIDLYFSFRKKQRENVKNDVKRNCNNYGRRRITLLLEYLIPMTKKEKRKMMKQSRWMMMMMMEVPKQRFIMSLVM